MSKVERFEDLIAWQKARLTRRVYELTRIGGWAKDFGLSSQIQRASVSIMSNIAEGFERNRHGEFHQFLSTAKASCAEVRSQLYVALDVGYLSDEEFKTVLAQAEEVGRIVGGLRASVQKKQAAATLSTQHSTLGTEESMLEFGITFKPDMPHQRMIALAKQAEAAGFGYSWIFDSHVLWQEAYPLMTLLAVNTKRMRLGTCVTNPAVRDATVTASLLATLNRISGGRMDLGIGRGDSSRRVMGKKPTTLERLEETVNVIRDLCAAKQIEYEGRDIQMPWAT